MVTDNQVSILLKYLQEEGKLGDCSELDVNAHQNGVSSIKRLRTLAVIRATLLS